MPPKILIAFFDVFVVVWENEAYKINVRILKDESKFLNFTTTMNNMTTAVNVQNYFPLRGTKIETHIEKRTGSEVENIENNQASFEEANIIISSYTTKLTYGDKELYPPSTVNNPMNFPILTSFGMCNATLIVNWSYISSLTSTNNATATNQTEHGTLYLPRIALLFQVEPGWLPSGIANTVWLVCFFLIFALCGGLFSWFYFEKVDGQKLNLMVAYGDLAELPTALAAAKANSDREENLKENLGKLMSFPNQAGFFKRLVFGLSFFILRIMINNNWKKHKDKIGSYVNKVPYRQKAYETILAKYSEQSLGKIEDSLPELKSIVAAIGFLAAVGITFSWNLGAAAPFVYSLVLSYFFFDLGSTFYFVGKSRKDLFWIGAVLTAAIIVVSFPSIISLLQF